MLCLSGFELYSRWVPLIGCSCCNSSGSLVQFEQLLQFAEVWGSCCEQLLQFGLVAVVWGSCCSQVQFLQLLQFGVVPVVAVVAVIDISCSCYNYVYFLQMLYLGVVAVVCCICCKQVQFVCLFFAKMILLITSQHYINCTI